VRKTRASRSVLAIEISTRIFQAPLPLNSKPL
jgi:hypothetical protein